RHRERRAPAAFGERAGIRHGGRQPGEDHRRADPLRRRQAVGSRPRGLAPRLGGLHRPQICVPRPGVSRAAKKEQTMLEQSNELAAWDRDHFFHPSTHMGMHARGEMPNRVMAGGEGATIWDTNGKKSLDAFAGLYCVNIGYGRQKIADAIAEQAKNLAYY